MTKSMDASTRLNTLLTLVFALSITSCAVGPNFASPDAPTVTSYTEDPLPEKTVATPDLKEGGDAQNFNFGAEIPAEWWELFHSPELNTLIERGIANNPTLQAALATLWEAEENFESTFGSTMLPAVTGAFSKQRIQYPPFATTSGITGGTLPPDLSFLTTPFPPFNLYNASVNVSYTLDVFGGNRRAVEGSAAQVDYQRYEVEAAYLTLTANIVTSAINEASLRAQIKATQDIIDIEAKQLTITEKQYALGGISKAGVLTQRTQLEQSRANLPTLEKNLAQTRSALAVLVGDFPGEAGLPVFHLDDLHLPTDLPVSVPSDLVRQRPDIQASEALLHASTAQIGVATANLLPKFPLNASIGSETGNFNNIFGAGSSLWSWQAQVTQAIFNGGALLAQREAAVAAFQAAYAQYELSVLTAFKNVADTLNALEMDAESLQAATAAEMAAKENLNLVQQQYFLGGTSYLNLLIAQQQYNQTYIRRISAEATRYADTAALFQAMGGGWWNTDFANIEGESAFE